MKKFPRLKHQVETILAKSSQTRNSDTLLTSVLWYEYYGHLLFKNANGQLSVTLKDMIEELPDLDRISRFRRKIQEEGKYLPTKLEIVKKRRQNEQIWHESMARVKMMPATY